MRQRAVLIIKGVLLSVGTGVAVAFVTAIVLGVLNVYLVGHGNDVFEKDISTEGIFQGGIDDLILVILTLFSFVLTLVTYLHSCWKNVDRIEG